jgi:cob(I)alamin adenosyltransferase
LNQATQSLRQNQATLARTVAHLKADRATLVGLNANDVIAKVNYAHKEANLTQAIRACNKALSLLGSLTSKTVFAQIHSSMDEVQESLAAFGSFSSSFSPILEILSQLKLSNKIDQSILNQLVNLISRLQAALEKERSESKTSEEARLVRVSAERLRLEASIRSLVRVQRVTSIVITGLKNKIESLNRQMKKNQSLLENARSQLASEVKRCNALAAEYKHQTAERSGELKIIDALIAHFNKTLAHTSADVRKLTGA